MSVHLYIVATPIGNLGDMSMRAIDVLKTVDLIAAEDTRHAKVLLGHYNISTPLTAFHDHNERQKTPELIDLMQQGQSLALISDAGTPLISDPGYRLVSAAQQAQLTVSPIPGACAAICALSSSGMPTDRFSFLGFLPAKSQARQQLLASVRESLHTTICYESPHRILDTLHDMQLVLEPQHQICLAREISKTFETIKTGSLEEIAHFVEQDPNQQKGEIVLIIAGKEKATAGTSDQSLLLLTQLMEHLPVKTAVQIVAQTFNLKKNELYHSALQLKSS